MSARPHEILNLKIKDIKFSLTEGGIQYAEVRISGGKTGSRTIPLIDSIPYLKEWLQEHPSSSNLGSWLFVSLGNNPPLYQLESFHALVCKREFYLGQSE